MRIVIAVLVTLIASYGYSQDSVRYENSRDNLIDSRDNATANKSVKKRTRMYIPRGYTYPKGRFPQGTYSPVKSPKNDFSEKLTIAEFEKVLAQKRREAQKRRKMNEKIDKKVAREMERKYYFLRNYGYIPSKAEIKKKGL